MPDYYDKAIIISRLIREYSAGHVNPFYITIAEMLKVFDAYMLQCEDGLIQLTFVINTGEKE